MAQIKLILAKPDDQKTFDQALAQTVAYAEATAPSEDRMIIVKTQVSFDRAIKTVTCAFPDALSFFIRSYDGALGHA